MKLYFYTFLALACSVVTMMILFWLLELTAVNWEWAHMGLSLVVFLVVIDLFQKFIPDSFPYDRVFTNARDTLVVVVAILIASAIAYIPEWRGNEAFWVQLIAHLLAVAAAGAISFLFGSSRLRKQLKRNKTVTEE